MVDEKPTSMFAGRPAKPASSLSTARPTADEGDDVYKTHPVFTSIVEPFANKFMSLQELIEVNDLSISIHMKLFCFIETTIGWFECFSGT